VWQFISGQLAIRTPESLSRFEVSGSAACTSVSRAAGTLWPSGTATRSKHCTIIHLAYHRSKRYGQVALPPIQNTVRSSTSAPTTGRSAMDKWHCHPFKTLYDHPTHLLQPVEALWPSGAATRSKHCTIIQLTFYHRSERYGQVALPPVQNTVRSSTSAPTTGRSAMNKWHCHPFKTLYDHAPHLLPPVEALWPSGTATRSKHCTIIRLTFCHRSKCYGQVALPPAQNTVRSSTSPPSTGRNPLKTFLSLPPPPNFKITLFVKQFLLFYHFLFNISIPVPRILFFTLHYNQQIHKQYHNSTYHNSLSVQSTLLHVSTLSCHQFTASALLSYTRSSNRSCWKYNL